MEKKISLNLGCFNKKLPNFINIDIRPEVNPDVIDNAFTLETFNENSVDLIYCCHMFEHLNYKDSLLALKRWYDVLRDGGILRLAVPDMEACFAHYFYWKDLKLLKSMLWGSQRHEFDFHYNGWDFQLLSEELQNVGFKNINRYDATKVEPHNYIDDYSHAYYPHGHKPMILGNGTKIDLGGKLMSLNIEAIK